MITTSLRSGEQQTLGWLGIVRLGLVQAALGAIVVLTTSTINRVMVVELALPAMIPGALVALHHALQLLRPRMGHGSDVGGRGTPWIVGGMAVLAVGGVLSAVATAVMATNLAGGIVLAVLAFALIGAGVSASGTSLLVLVAKRVAPVIIMGHFPSTETPDETTPHPNAHIGGNHVIGFNSSATVDRLGRAVNNSLTLSARADAISSALIICFASDARCELQG